MNVFAQILAVLNGILLIGVGVLEAFFFRSERLYPFFRIRQEDHRAVRLWTVNLGFYNIVWGLGLILGVVLAGAGEVTVGRTIVIFASAANVILGLVLVASDRRLWRGALAQSGIALAVLIATLL